MRRDILEEFARVQAYVPPPYSAGKYLAPIPKDDTDRWLEGDASALERIRRKYPVSRVEDQIKAARRTGASPASLAAQHNISVRTVYRMAGSVRTEEIAARNRRMVEEYKAGAQIGDIASRHHVSDDTVRLVVHKAKRMVMAKDLLENLWIYFSEMSRAALSRTQEDDQTEYRSAYAHAKRCYEALCAELEKLH